MDHASILADRAILQGSEAVYCENCDEMLVFTMQAGHSLTLGLSQILECLKVAELHGAVPALPAHWWTMICSQYHKVSLQPCHLISAELCPAG